MEAFAEILQKAVTLLNKSLPFSDTGFQQIAALLSVAEDAHRETGAVFVINGASYVTRSYPGTRSVFNRTCYTDTGTTLEFRVHERNRTGVPPDQNGREGWQRYYSLVVDLVTNWVNEREVQLSLHNYIAELGGVVEQKQRELENATSQLSSLTNELCLTEARGRREIAGFLHDQIGQSLALIKIKLEYFRRNQVFSGCDMELVELGVLLENTIRSTRSLTLEISPPVLYELGLDAACQWLAKSFAQKHKMKIDYQSQGLNPLPEEIQVTLFKSTQELLTNCLKHAQATQVRLELLQNKEQVVIRVTDNGKGFDPGQVRHQEAFGLFSIRTRLQYLGGHLEIDSAPGSGCRSSMVIPRGEQL